MRPDHGRFRRSRPGRGEQRPHVDGSEQPRAGLQRRARRSKIVHQPERTGRRDRHEAELVSGLRSARGATDTASSNGPKAAPPERPERLQPQTAGDVSGERFRRSVPAAKAGRAGRGDRHHHARSTAAIDGEPMESPDEDRRQIGDGFGTRAFFRDEQQSTSGAGVIDGVKKPLPGRRPRAAFSATRATQCSERSAATLTAHSGGRREVRPACGTQPVALPAGEVVPAMRAVSRPEPRDRAARPATGSRRKRGVEVDQRFQAV